MKLDASTLTIWHGLCVTVEEAAKANPNNSGLQYAAAYAARGVFLSTPAEIQPQALYIRSNLSTWHGEIAKASKRSLDMFSQVQS